MLMDERPPLVTFETRAVEDRSKLVENGYYGFKDVDFVMVMPAGGKDVFEDKADKWLEKQQKLVRDKRVPPEHLEYFKRQYKAFKEGESEVIDGTPIKSWPVLTPAQIKSVLQANIKSVEDLAVAPDDALSMIGMGARAFQQKAKNWLESAKGNGVATQRLTDLENKLKEAFDLIEKQNKYIAELELSSSEDKPKRRGRPPKEEADAA